MVLWDLQDRDACALAIVQNNVPSIAQQNYMVDGGIQGERRSLDEGAWKWYLSSDRMASALPAQVKILSWAESNCWDLISNKSGQKRNLRAWILRRCILPFYGVFSTTNLLDHWDSCGSVSMMCIDVPTMSLERRLPNIIQRHPVGAAPISIQHLRIWNLGPIRSAFSKFLSSIFGLCSQ